MTNREKVARLREWCFSCSDAQEVDIGEEEFDELLALLDGEPVAWLCECMIEGGSNWMVDDITTDKLEADDYVKPWSDPGDVITRVRPLYLHPGSQDDE